MRKEYGELSDGRKAAVRAELKSRPHKNTTQSPVQKKESRVTAAGLSRARKGICRRRRSRLGLFGYESLLTNSLNNLRLKLRSNSANHKAADNSATPPQVERNCKLRTTTLNTKKHHPEPCTQGSRTTTAAER